MYRLFLHPNAAFSAFFHKTCPYHFKRISSLFFINQILILVLLIVSSSFYGCFPAYYTYWAPVAEEGELIHPVGYYAIAPKDTIEFCFNDVKIEVTGFSDVAGFGLYIPRGRIVTFVSDEAVLKGIIKEDIAQIKFDVTAFVGINEYPHINPTGKLVEKFYTGSILFNDRAVMSKYKIKLPPIKVDGQIYEIPEIEFTRKKGFGVFGP